MEWFQNIYSIAELRKTYRILLKRYHPDNEGGSLEITQEINKEYDMLFSELLKNEDVENKQYTTEENENFKNVLKQIINFNIEIEIIGNWIWCFEAYGYKERLKELGFKWAVKKKAWTWHNAPYRKNHGREIPIEEIRAKYGGETVRRKSRQSLLNSW
ncbi:hypothetical protein [Dorea phocaeensis]|mgnify:FL=1|uniref:hypothetical protein n=1 Tax=Dorea phocaeensis TaxID=2040291 RepID=UPI000C76967A|nr:hypothetical protein [Dorea phocaeensis]